MEDDINYDDNFNSSQEPTILKIEEVSASIENIEQHELYVSKKSGDVKIYETLGTQQESSSKFSTIGGSGPVKCGSGPVKFTSKEKPRFKVYDTIVYDKYVEKVDRNDQFKLIDFDDRLKIHKYNEKET